MICPDGLSFINDYIESLNKILQQENKQQLTKIQRYWIKFVLLGILVTNSVCWVKMERFSIGIYSNKAISWMFRHGKVCWGLLLTASIKHIIKKYKIKNCVLGIDDSDKSRSKNTTEIAKAHKIKDKKTAGYMNGQNIVFLVLVSNGITLPVGFKLYEPDPEVKKSKGARKALKAKGVLKKYLPKEVKRSRFFPTKVELALLLLKEFTINHPSIKITAVVADALYGTKQFVAQALIITKKAQIITELKSTQNIVVNNKTIQLAKFFKHYMGKQTIMQLRYNNKSIQYVASKFTVKSHNQKYWVIALKYEGEENYRYLIASNMSWQATDVLQTYALRWLIEIFIQDWKSNEGWDSMAKQPGIDGSIRGITLSLLCDHALLTHPEQIALFKKWEPAYTVGSLREKVMLDSLLEFIKTIINSDNPHQLFETYKNSINQIFVLRKSTKHIRNNYISNVLQSTNSDCAVNSESIPNAA
jgi:DDE superfamily endonuclease